MTYILQRYKIIAVAFCLLVLAVLIGLIVSRQNSKKIPSRGVFVMNGAITQIVGKKQR
jgi:uncharacterized membrane protein